MAETKRDLYEVLGVSKTAGAEDLKKAYRKLARKYHPDVNRNDPSAERRFKEVQEAYDILTDSKKRQAYDQFGHAGVSSSAAAEAAAAAAASGRRQGGFRYATQTPGGATVDFGEVDLHDIFESFVGNRRSRGSRNPYASGGFAEAPEAPATADITHEVMLSFEAAIKGTTLDLRLDTVNRAHSETIAVKIPPGVHEGSKVRVRGRGQPAMGGRSRGDLIISIHVAAHPYFVLVGQDIILDVPISAGEAASGTTIRVPTIDGPLEMRVPAGIVGGMKLRLKGRGVPTRNGPAGDQLCRIVIQLPEELTEAEKQYLQQMDQAHHFNPRAKTAWKL
ncbi:MAG: DnaJ domain-containing protein [Phycisphaerae bacterium]|nr:DnaJ domain-containing protein [Phycisphaerae bacterium]